MTTAALSAAELATIRTCSLRHDRAPAGYLLTLARMASVNPPVVFPVEVPCHDSGMQRSGLLCAPASRSLPSRSATPRGSLREA